MPGLPLFSSLRTTYYGIAVAAALTGACLAPPLSAAAAENRCGWIVNPTPGNYWLDDAKGTWIIMSQGIPDEPEGVDKIGDLSAGDYVRTNGNYGYGCTCMNVDTANRDGVGVITAIHSVKPLALARCRADKSLPKPQD
ncbi:DUF4087 domain-containing protein [Allorhizobium undicola]|uniref:DUF4087 domain-containing protein n=1 Tax=Allorhizobium undicola TaxID=78527 RepID=UPI000684F168|nr:DUF4087 domain-containing protein [Allorhizobium undicola]